MNNGFFMFIFYRLEKNNNGNGFAKNVCDDAVHENDNFDYLIAYKTDTDFSQPTLSTSKASGKTSDLFNETVDEGVKKLQLDNGRLCYKIFKQTHFKRFELFALILQFVFFVALRL